MQLSSGLTVYCSIKIRNYSIICEKKTSFSVFLLLPTAKSHENKHEIEIRIQIDAVFRKAGEQKISPEKRWEMGKESASLDGQGNLLLVFFWQNFYFPLVYSYLNRFFFLEILKIKKDLSGALQRVLCLIPYFSLVNCITLAYKIFYPIFA